MHEFLAYQTLLAGKNRRWLLVLVELASSNLNFSTEAVVSLVTRLALQAGPADDNDPLRAIHKVFRDSLFCKRLLEQVDQRLEGISSHWREANCMDMLLTLILRCNAIGSQLAGGEALQLLE